MRKIVVEATPSPTPGEFQVVAHMDDNNESIRFQTDESDSMRIMHEIAEMIRRYFIFQKE